MAENFELNNNDKEGTELEDALHKLQEQTEVRERELAITNPIQWQIAQTLFPEEVSPEERFEKYLSSGFSKKFRELLETDTDLKERMMKGENVLKEIMDRMSN